MGIRRYLRRLICDDQIRWDEQLEQLREMWGQYLNARELRESYQALESHNKEKFWKSIKECNHPEIAPRARVLIDAIENDRRNGRGMRGRANAVREEITSFLGLKE